MQTHKEKTKRPPKQKKVLIFFVSVSIGLIHILGVDTFIELYLHTSSMISRLREMGFSQKIALPAFAAAMICPACWSVGEQMTTASTSGSLMSCVRVKQQPTETR